MSADGLLTCTCHNQANVSCVMFAISHVLYTRLRCGMLGQEDHDLFARQLRVHCCTEDMSLQQARWMIHAVD